MGLLGGDPEAGGGGSKDNGSYALFGGAAAEEDECCDVCPEMSWTTRAQGYLACTAVAFLFNFLAMISLWAGDPVTFGMIYVFAELCLLVGSFFLSKPGAQCKAMFQSLDHTIASVVWIGSLGLILLAVFTIGGGAGGMILICFLVVVEKLAYLWYTLAFFPGGHWAASAMVKGMVAGCCGG